MEQYDAWAKHYWILLIAICLQYDFFNRVGCNYYCSFTSKPFLEKNEYENHNPNTVVYDLWMWFLHVLFVHVNTS